MLQNVQKKAKGPATAGAIKFNKKADIEISYNIVMHNSQLVVTITEPRDPDDDKFEKSKRKKFSTNILRTVLPITDAEADTATIDIYRWLKELKNAGEIVLNKKQAQDMSNLVIGKVENLLVGLGMLDLVQ